MCVLYVCLRHSGKVSVSLVVVTLSVLHNTASYWASLYSVNIVAQQEVLPTQNVLLHKVNNNTEGSADVDGSPTLCNN